MRVAPYKCSDGGRAEAGIVDKNDCTIRAVAHATGHAYAYIHLIAHHRGRRPGKGFNPVILIKALTYPQSEQITQYPYRATLGSLLPMLQKGRFILYTRDHAFAVVNGVVLDSFPPRLRWQIVGIWKVNKEG